LAKRTTKFLEELKNYEPMGSVKIKDFDIGRNIEL